MKGRPKRHIPNAFWEGGDLVFEGDAADQRRRWNGRALVANYCYTDEHGKPISYVGRTRDRQFPQWLSGEKRLGLRGKKCPYLYHLPRLLEGIAEGATIHFAEGEKDVLALEATGHYATTNPGGAGKLTPEQARWLERAKAVIVWADRDQDQAGRRHARKVVDVLLFEGVPCSVVEAKEGKDAYDHLAAGFASSEATPVLLAEEPTVSKSGASSTADGKLPTAALTLLGTHVVQAMTEPRNETGFKLACQLRNHRISQAQAEQVLRIYVSAVPEKENNFYTVSDAMASVAQAYAKNPDDPYLPIESEDDGDGFTLGSDVQVKPVSWVWKGYLPLGKISILEGNPDRFKTTIAMDLIARVTKGKAMPGAKKQPTEPGSVLVVCAEDDADDTLVPRLMAVGANLTRLGFYKVDRDDDGQVVPLALPDDLRKLEGRIHKLTARTGLPVRLVVIDPITAYLSEKINSHNDASVRKALYPLADLASRREVAVLLVRHLNKDGSLQAEFRGGGSIAFTGAARSVLVVEKHPDEPGKYVLARVKNNLHVPVPSVVYEGAANLNFDAPMINWLAHLDLDADALLRGRDGRTAAPVRKAAEAFLCEVLSDGPMKVPELQALAKRAGISWRTVERAKEELHLTVTPVREVAGTKIDHWQWSLPYPTPPQTATVPAEGSK